MAWTTPKTDWATGELVAASDLNAMGDNDSYLKDRVDGSNAKQYVRTGGDYVSSSSTLVDIDATNLALTITTNGGDVICTISGKYKSTGSNARPMYFAIDVDGTPTYLIKAFSNSGAQIFGLSYVFTGLSAGSHTFKLRWYISPSSSGEMTLYDGVLFDVRETMGVVA